MINRIVCTIAVVLCLTLSTRLLAQADVESTHGPTKAEPAQLDQSEHGDVGRDKPPLLPDPRNKETWMQALWTLIIFLVMLAILYKTAWKNILAGLKAREARIRKDIADAETARSRAEATLREYNTQLATAENKVREMIASAVAQGEKAAADIRMRAQQEAEENKQRAVREIDAARKQALTEIYATAADLSTSIASKILRRNINADDQRDLVRQSLSQLETVGR